MDRCAREFARNSYNAVRRPLRHWASTVFDHAPKLLILAYHRVLPDVGHDPMRMVIRLKTFIEQIDRLALRYPVVSLADAANQCLQARPRARLQVALTFDDGYWDNYEMVFPVLNKKGLSAVFFIATDHIDGCAEFSDGRVLDKKTGAVHDYIKDRFISWDEARAMSRAGMEIGSHGVSHRSLAVMPAEEARDEIRKSKEKIELNLRKRCEHFAFPFGSKRDYNQSLIDYVREAGYGTCMLNVHGYNHFSSDIFCFRRIIMEEATSISHILG